MNFRSKAITVVSIRVTFLIVNNNYLNYQLNQDYKLAIRAFVWLGGLVEHDLNNLHSSSGAI